MKKIVPALMSLAFVAAAANPVGAEELQRLQLKVIGGWTNVAMTTALEQPFWEKRLPEMSGGKITADFNSLDTLGLKGNETLRLLSLKIADVVTGPVSFVAGDFKLYDGLDLSGAILDIGTMRKAANAYRPVIEKNMQENFKAHLLMMWPSPPQVLFCKGEIKGVADLAGKKIRTFNQTLSDFVEAVGGTPVNISFAEVVPALQRGTADCGITGTGSGNTAKWWEVTDHLYPLVLGWAPWFSAMNNDTWNSLDEPTKAFLTDAFAKLEDDLWALVDDIATEAVNCNIGVGECKTGIKANMKLVEVSEADRALLAGMVTETILPRWAERCGEACAADWNATVGKTLGFEAKAN
ncbi:TRAP transporter substrate-binding protein [Oceanibacterium hippocampi]|uniref:Bacterial extracellular solute-binding protein, family 7 n=1 Tax=Oceanibacterium hippocampi TaxID=745714 RepID=A0A1Y5TZZ3_9PROT|nr:TRAP transporter substrate-binding protein [Oceanibacterium hippocampi]SLN75646.1 Bacterial extracellular solute-binding protein, family 7 [Oceanibacterium hippocampi]